jgi:uncharacterized membrane protein YqaE (UPF0057 family)
MARIPLVKRLTIAVMNIVFPPVAVMLLTNSCNADVLLNSILFLLAVIPSHVHGFYLSWTYFNRKRKVRRGVYPGDKHSGIWSDRINQGGATRKEYLRLKEEKDFGKRKSNTRTNSWKLRAGDSSEDMERSPTQRSNRTETPRPGVDRQLSNRIERWDDGFDSDTISATSQSTGVGARRSRTPKRRRSGRSGHVQAPATRTRSQSRSASRPRSLTRQLSDRLEDTVRRRLTEREDRRRQRRDEEDLYGEGDNYASTEPVQMVEVQRWR